MKPDALIVIDVQQGLTDMHPYQEETVIGNIQKLIAACRKAGVPVIYVQHEETEAGGLVRDTPAWQVDSRIAPQDSDARFYKNVNSAFRGTGLHEHLQALGAHNLLLCGMQTEYCVDVSCKVAFELGYSVTLPRGGTTTYDNRLFKAQDLIKYYEYFIWAGRLAKTAPMDTLLSELGA
jgi:nicotinamidase-related amidase